MHDKYGRQIQLGDVVLAKSWAHGYKDQALKVIGCNEGTETCNVTVVAFEPQINALTLNARDTEIILKADGTRVCPPPVEVA